MGLFARCSFINIYLVVFMRKRLYPIIISVFKKKLLGSYSGSW